MHDFNFLYSYLIRKKRKLFSKYHKNIIDSSDFIKLFAKIFYFVPSYICFDQDTKMSIETEKQANFFVLDKQIFDVSQTDNFEKLIKSVYISGEKKY